VASSFRLNQAARQESRACPDAPTARTIIKQSGELPLPASRKLQAKVTVELEGQSAQEQ
jgi:hypothetical protein